MKTSNCTATIESRQPIQLSEIADILARIPATLVALLLSAFGVLIVWQQRAEMRHRLAHLDPALMEDMGLTRDQIETEIAKYVWER